MTDLTTTRTPEVIAAEVRALTATVLTNVIEIGRRFAEAKALLPHGEFGAWLESSTGYSQRTANNFMRLVDAYGDPQADSDHAGEPGVVRREPEARQKQAHQHFYSHC